MQDQLGDLCLRHICAVETVKTVGPVDAVLSLQGSHVPMVHEESLLLKDIVFSLLDKRVDSTKVVTRCLRVEIVIYQPQELWLQAQVNL